MDQPGKAASPARGQLNREIYFLAVPDRAWEFGLARRIRQSRPASACAYPYSGWIWCLLAEPNSAAASIYLLKTALRHRVSPDFIGSRTCVPMVFTAESPPARGQYTSKRVLRWQFTMDQLIRTIISHTHYWYEVGMLKYHNIPTRKLWNNFVSCRDRWVDRIVWRRHHRQKRQNGQ